MTNENTKLSYIKMGLLIFLFILMFSFAYFLLYSPFKVNDNQLLIITMIFTTLVVAIPLYIFMEKEELKKENTIKQVSKKKKRKKSSKS